MLHHNRLSNNLSTYNATLPKEYSTPKTYKWLKLPKRFLNIHLHGYVVMLTISNPLWKLSPFPSPLIPQLYIFIAPPLSEQSLVVAPNGLRPHPLNRPRPNYRIPSTFIQLWAYAIRPYIMPSSHFVRANRIRPFQKNRHAQLYVQNAFISINSKINTLYPYQPHKPSPCHLTSTIHYHPKKNPSTKEA